MSKDQRQDQLRPCQGCGRMTRNTRMSIKDYPNTVTRQTAEHCTKCARTERRNQRSEEELAQLEAEKQARREAGYAAARRDHDAFLRQRNARIANRQQHQRRISA